MSEIYFPHPDYQHSITDELPSRPLSSMVLSASESRFVRVGNELGAGNPKAAAFSVLTVTTVSFLIALVEAMIVLSVRHVISYAFTGGETVAHAVSDLCPLLAITIILNGIQPVLSGVAVGCGWQAYVAYVNVGCYYIVGIPLGLLLGFHFNFGVKVPFINHTTNVTSKTGI
ncbi:putative multi antimicrobial extrusion protein [Helianthus annuus]|nr:putative multi antimicrobial extrusion protein [Helianthus annuus]